MIGLIWAQAKGGVIGRDGAIPWRLPEDMAHFRTCTGGGTVMMGRLTWESLPDRFRPLPGRRNVVLTRRSGWQPPGAEAAGDLETALGRADGDVWVIGGADVYAQALRFADRVERTEVELDVDGDTVAPSLDAGWRLVRCDPAEGWNTSCTGLRYRICSFVHSGSSWVPAVSPARFGRAEDGAPDVG